MKKLSIIVVGLFTAAVLLSTSVFAGGRSFVGIGPRPFFSHGGAPFFGFRHSNDRFIVNFGAQREPLFLHGHRASGYYYPPAIPYPHSTGLSEPPRGGFSGADSSGLYIDGYRVMPTGWLRVQVEPTDAQLLIDGFPAGVDKTHGNSASIGLTTGSHLVEVQRSGFQTHRSEIDIKQAREVFVRIKLDE